MALSIVSELVKTGSQQNIGACWRVSSLRTSTAKAAHSCSSMTGVKASHWAPTITAMTRCVKIVGFGPKILNASKNPLEFCVHLQSIP